MKESNLKDVTEIILRSSLNFLRFILRKTYSLQIEKGTDF